MSGLNYLKGQWALRSARRAAGMPPLRGYYFARHVHRANKRRENKMGKTTVWVTIVVWAVFFWGAVAYGVLKAITTGF